MIKDILIAQSKIKTKFENLEAIISEGNIQKQFEYIRNISNIKFLEEIGLKEKFINHINDKTNQTLNHPIYKIEGNQLEIRVIDEKNRTWAYVHVRSKESRILKTPFQDYYYLYVTKNQALERNDEYEYNRINHLFEKEDINHVMNQTEDLLDYMELLNEYIGFEFKTNIKNDEKESKLVHYLTHKTYVSSDYQNVIVKDNKNLKNLYFLDLIYEKDIIHEKEFLYEDVCLKNIEQHQFYNEELNGIHYFKENRSYLLKNNGHLIMIGKNTNVREFLINIDIENHI